MVSKPVKFRSALGGYNKKDVNEYIAQRAKENQLQLEEKEATIASLKKQTANEQERRQAQKEIRKACLYKQIACLYEQIACIRVAANEVLSQLAQADEQVKKGLADAQKAKKYDQLAQGLGQLLNVEVKAEEEVQTELPDRCALSASVLGSLQALSDSLSQLQESVETEE